MAAPKVKRQEGDDLIDRELERWPGVTWTRGVRSKHYELVLTFAGASRVVVYSASGSDRRGALNCIADIRKELRGVGAKRLPEPKTTRQKVYRASQERRPILTVVDGGRRESGPLRDPWEALSRVEIKPPRKTFWGWLRGLAEWRRS